MHGRLLTSFTLNAALDYQGPVELLGFISPGGRLSSSTGTTCPYLIDITYLSHTLEPVEISSGPKVLPTRAYDDIGVNEQFDIVFIPGGRFS